MTLLFIICFAFQLQANINDGKNTTVKAQDPYELLDTTPQEGMTAAFFDWKEVKGTLAISRKERRQNSGRHAMFNLIEGKSDQLEMSFREEVNRQIILGDGTDAGDKEIEGIALAIKDTPTTGTYGVIDPASETWWRNQYDNTAYSFAANGLAYLRLLYRKASRSDVISPVDLILCDGELYDTFEAEHVLHLQFSPTGKSNEAMFNLGIENFRYKKATVMEDEQLDADAGSKKIYGVNSEFTKLAVDKESNFVILPAVTPSNQTATVAPMVLMANLCCNNRRKNFVKTAGSV
ncbi:MAG: phage major capsid protein [Candidatus Margulisiibacteriota bacterium]|nr:phage major capsid protein [Candidatus Margulisiibacteriota bacterium]